MRKLVLPVTIAVLWGLAGPAGAQVLMGDQSLGNYADNNNAGLVEAFQYTAYTAGNASDIELYVNSGSTATAVSVGLYSDANGKPGNLLGSGSLQSPRSQAWNDVKLASTVALGQGKQFWIALLGTGGAINYLDTAGGSAPSYVNSTERLTSLPQTYSPGAEYNVSPASAYVNGTSGTGGMLLGDQSMAPSADSNNAGLAQAFAYQAAASGTSTDIELYVNSGTAASKLLLGIYSGANGKPDSLLASGSIAKPRAGVWNDVHIGSVTVTAGKTYWIALLGTGGKIDFRDTWGGSGASYIESAAGLSALPATYSSGTEYSASPASAYVMGLAGGQASTNGSAPPSGTTAPVITGQTVQGQTLTTSTGSWTGSPTSYGYAWEDCNSSGSGCSNIGGATSSSYTLQSSDVGHMVEVTVSAGNVGGSGQATSSGVGPVQAAAQPVAPSNTGVPTISGSPQAGQTLTAGPGTWSGDTPMTYSYLWSDGSTGQTDTLSSSDVGQNISVSVMAKNDGGSASARSESVGPVTAASSSGMNCAGTAGSGTPNYASLDACGFPSPDTTGVPAGTTLTPYTGPSNITTAGTTITGAEITSPLTISANNVTIEDSDIDVANQSAGAIRIGSGTTGALVEYDSIHGTSATSAGNLQAAVYNTNYSDDANAVTVDHVDFYDGQRILHGPGTLTNSFCLDNVAVSGAHYECIYEGGGSVTINHNTLLTAFGQTAAIFVSTDFAALDNVSITDNLLAGGGYVIYGDATNEHNYGITSEAVTGNRFSRIYYADSGQYGPEDGEYMPSNATWSGNVWDDTGQPVSP